MGEGAMKKLVVALVIGCIIFGAGCTGPFKLTKRIHDWQTSFDSKWVDELAFLGCAILPVYGLCMLGDAIIFNSIEFWGGTNPIASTHFEKDGKAVDMALRPDGSIYVSDGRETLILERSAAGVTAKDASGNVKFRAVKDENNLVSVYDASGALIKRSGS
jgi:hypothetical protein